MDDSWLDDRGVYLGPDFPLPLDRPFRTDQASTSGVSRHQLAGLKREGLVREVLRGVHVAAQAPDDMRLRAAALGLVISDSAVVCGRTAAWLHGVDLLPRSSRDAAPPVDVVHLNDTRVRRPEVDGRRRLLVPSDITIVHGIPVTTALRTALDLGRLLRRHDALAALDGFLRIGVPPELLSAEIGRFKGFRGVRQLRALVPLADPRSESVAEAALRLDWYDAGLPRPDLQVWVHDDDGVAVYRLDITLPEILYAVEYDGEEFHTDDEHDERRREWCGRRGWHFEVFTKTDVYDRRPDPLPRLRAGFTTARSRSRWEPYGRPRRTS